SAPPAGSRDWPVAARPSPNRPLGHSDFSNTPSSASTPPKPNAARSLSAGPSSRRLSALPPGFEAPQSQPSRLSRPPRLDADRIRRPNPQHAAQSFTGATLEKLTASTIESRQPPTGSASAPSDLERIRADIHRKPPPAKFGAIDVGTNSIHLVMAEISPDGDFHILGRDKDMVRLGEGGFARHVLTERAMADGLAALTRFAKMAALKGVSPPRAVAPSAAREPRNGGEFAERARKPPALPPHIIPPEEEARLIYLAVRHAVDLGAADNLIVDVGGGSVE